MKSRKLLTALMAGLFAAGVTVPALAADAAPAGTTAAPAAETAAPKADAAKAGGMKDMKKVAKKKHHKKRAVKKAAKAAAPAETAPSK